MAVNIGQSYTGEQLRSMGFNPDLTGSSQNVGGQNYTLVNDNGMRKVTMGGAPSSSSSSSVGDPNKAIAEAIKLSQQAVQPSVDALKSSIPTTQQYYSNAQQRTTEKIAPLEERYKSLLDSIKSNQTTAENRQTVATNNELGRRGVIGGLAEQTLADAVNPITAQYSGMLKDTGFQREADIKALQDQAAQYGDQGQLAVSDINKAIANILSGASTSGINLGNSQYQFGVSTDLQREQMAQQQQQAAIQQAIAQQQQQFAQQQAAADQAFRDKQFAESIRQFNTQEGRLGANSGGKMDPFVKGILEEVMKQFNNSNTGSSGGGTWEVVEKTPIGQRADGRYIYSDGSVG